MKTLCSIFLLSGLLLSGFAQKSLLTLPDEPILLTFHDYPLVYIPQDGDSGFQPNMNCSSLPNPTTVVPEFFQVVERLSTEDAFVPFVALCDGSVPNPHGSIYDEQIVVAFRKEKLTLFLSVKREFISSSDYNKGIGVTFYYDDVASLSTDMWTVLDENVFGFVQTIIESDTTRYVNSVEGTEEIETWESFKRIYNLFSINEEGITRIVYSLPLADYEWDGNKQTPELIDQLQVQIFGNVLHVIALTENLTELQQSWVGMFAFNKK